MSKFLRPFISLLFISCQLNSNDQNNSNPFPDARQQYETIRDIPCPEGYKRIEQDNSSFGHWLNDIHLKKDNHVYLYNGLLKKNQSAQFAVLDMPVGKKDLQQCADAVMRLRAEYLFDQKRYDEITFIDNSGKSHAWNGGDNKKGFGSYLENVFGWCGTASLEKQLKPVEDLNEMEPGDVFIRGGFPGHAMIVIDIAINEKGKKLFMLAQSYMPAQDIHLVKNPLSNELSPWYELNDNDEIVTPEWIFKKDQLKKW